MNPQAIIDTLAQFVSENKQNLIDQVLAERTRHITLVFEDIEKPHNVSAVLRTAECMGIQDLHFINNKNSYSVNPLITQGAAKWISMHDYVDVPSCFGSLKEQGYQVYATSLHETSRSIYELDPSEKTAIVFGTESDGISEEAGVQADGFVHIPMSGFTESFNLSVSAAICMTILKTKLGAWPPLATDEQLLLKSEWYRKVVREADLILKAKGVEL